MTPEQIGIVGRLIRSAGSGVNWMDQMLEGELLPETRTLLAWDAALCHEDVIKAREMLKQVKEETP